VAKLSAVMVFGHFGNRHVALEGEAELTGMDFAILTDIDVSAGAGRALARQREKLDDPLLGQACSWRVTAVVRY